MTEVRTYIYIYTYIQTLAQNRTAVIKISCLATLGNHGCIVAKDSLVGRDGHIKG